MEKVVLIKTNDVLVPATAKDLETLQFIPSGSSVNANITTKSHRSLRMHRMYWALIELALDYWEPDSGLIKECENEFGMGLIEFVRQSGRDCDAIRQLVRLYKKNLSESRTGAFEVVYKDSQMLHNWIKEQIGLYDLVMTPDGLVKKTKSISFDKMSHERWMQYYSQAFSVVWQLVLSEVFKNKEDAKEAIEKLSKLG